MMGSDDGELRLDTGIWIPEDNLPPEPGQLMAALHGAVGVEIQVNQGSTFYFALPVDVAHSRESSLIPNSLRLNGPVTQGLLLCGCTGYSTP
jgi:hypothetical protein